MKKILSVLLCAVLLAGCSSAASESTSADSSSASSEVVSSESTESSSEEVSSESTSEETASKSDTINSYVASLEEVNPIANPRVLDDFSVENDMLMTMDNIVAFKGDVTNDQADCGLVFVAQVKDTQTAVDELQAYKDSLSTNLYAEFADKVALAKDARIVTKDDIVIMVIASLNGPDYATIDAAIDAL